MSKDRLTASRRLEFALALLEQNDIPAALDVAQAAIEADPDWDETHFVLGDLFEKAGQPEKAIEAFRHCLALDPQDRRGAEVRLTLLGAMAQRDRLPPDYVRALFDDYAPRFDAALRDGLAYRGPELLFEVVRTLLPGLPRPLRLLDLGCGTGLAGDIFAAHVDGMDGVDLSPRMINRARAKGLYQILMAADITALPATQPGGLADRYGLVVAADVLNYLGDLAPVFAAATARMEMGGLMVFSLEDGDIYPFDLGRGQRFRHHGDAVRGWLAQAGLDIVSDATGILRQEKGVPVTGRFMVVRRAPVAVSLPGSSVLSADPDSTAMPQTMH
ncbi:MAG: methyltransferase domain-containing protein [Pseudomonadota bacterium]